MTKSVFEYDRLFGPARSSGDKVGDVPFRAHSGGTLICLGADEIVMTPQAELSPIDPTTGNQFNPPDPGDKLKRLGISVEDVTAYIDLARDKEKVGLKSEEHVLEVVKELARQVHPLALGNVQRTYTQIRFLAKKLLETHNEKLAEDKIKRIVNALATEFYSHLHMINRREARDLLGQNIVKQSTPDLADLMENLFGQYEELFQLNSAFSLNEWLANRIEGELDVYGAVIETENLALIFKTRLKVTKRSQLPPNIQVQIQPGQPLIVPGFPVAFEIEMIFQGWYENKERV